MSAWSYQTAPELSDEEYARWQALLEQRTGICFLQHKSILQKGLCQRMREVGADDYERYFQQVSAIPAGAVEWSKLVDRISVKETSFFRDPKSFDVVRDYLLDLLEKQQRKSGETLDVWSVGCATGEEAYSLALVASEVMCYLQADCFLGVMATDISQTALNVARQGIYSLRKVEKLPLALKNKYFSVSGENSVRVLPELRQRLCFTQGNMLELEQAPRLAMDVIYCQNVLIYFRRELQRQVLDGLIEHLKPGGMLVVGPGEVMNWHHSKMQRYPDMEAQAYIKNLSN